MATDTTLLDDEVVDDEVAATDPSVGTSARAAEQRAARRTFARRLVPVLAAFLLVFVVFMASPATSRSDPFWVPYTAQSLLADRDLDLADHGVELGDDYALVESDGQLVSYFPWTTAALTTPLVVLYRALEPTGLVEPFDEQLDRREVHDFQRFAGSVFAAAAATALALVARRLIRMTRAQATADAGAGEPNADETGSTARASVADRAWFVPAGALVIALGTSLWSTASRGLWQHGPGVLALGAAWLAALSLSDAGSRRSDRWLAPLSGALAGLACGIRPTNAVFAMALGAFIAWRRRDALMTWVIGGMAVVAAGLAANVVLLGSPLQSYFSGDRAGLHADYLHAVTSDLISPSRGLLVFSPWLALGAVAFLPARRRLLGSDMMAFAWTGIAASFVALLAAASYGERWWAGHSYGPRFLTETLVVLAPLALVVVFGPRPPGRSARLVTSVLAPVLIAVSVAMHAPGALTAVTECWNRTPVDVDARPDRVDDWSDPQFSTGWRSLITDGPGAPPDECQDRRT